MRPQKRSFASFVRNTTLFVGFSASLLAGLLVILDVDVLKSWGLGIVVALTHSGLFFFGRRRGRREMRIEMQERKRLEEIDRFARIAYHAALRDRAELKDKTWKLDINSRYGKTVRKKDGLPS